MIDEDRIIVLEEAVGQARKSHAWMLETIKYKARETQGDNFSDELKHAIATQALLDALE